MLQSSNRYRYFQLMCTTCLISCAARCWLPTGSSLALTFSPQSTRSRWQPTYWRRKSTSLSTEGRNWLCGWVLASLARLLTTYLPRNWTMRMETKYMSYFTGRIRHRLRSCWRRVLSKSFWRTITSKICLSCTETEICPEIPCFWLTVTWTVIICIRWLSSRFTHATQRSFCSTFRNSSSLCVLPSIRWLPSLYQKVKSCRALPTT